MSIIIRPEEPEHYPAVFSVIEAAFKEEEYSDGKEQFLVERLRKSEAFIPELSLVAVDKKIVVGHILLTKIQIQDGDQQHPSLALAPVSVLPSYQGRKIGSQLITKAHKVAKALGYNSVMLLGHAGYYPRFGYELCINHGIQLPFEVPPENCMVVALRKNGLDGVKGMVVYPREFFE